MAQGSARENGGIGLRNTMAIPDESMTEGPYTCECLRCSIAENNPEQCPNWGKNDPVLQRALETSLNDDFTYRILSAHSGLLGRGSSKWPRVEHIREFCIQMGVEKVGLACCSAFLQHAQAVSRYLEEKGIASVTVCCKVGALRLEDLGIDRGLSNTYYLCNSVGQAEMLNACKTQMNVLLGLCAPHDMVVAWHAKAPCTTLFAKEHITNHSPFSTIEKMTSGKR